MRILKRSCTVAHCRANWWLSQIPVYRWQFVGRPSSNETPTSWYTMAISFPTFMAQNTRNSHDKREINRSFWCVADGRSLSSHLVEIKVCQILLPGRITHEQTYVRTHTDTHTDIVSVHFSFNEQHETRQHIYIKVTLNDRQGFLNHRQLEELYRLRTKTKTKFRITLHQ